MKKIIVALLVLMMMILPQGMAYAGTEDGMSMKVGSGWEMDYKDEFTRIDVSTGYLKAAYFWDELTDVRLFYMKDGDAPDKSVLDFKNADEAGDFYDYAEMVFLDYYADYYDWDLDEVDEYVSLKLRDVISTEEGNFLKLEVEQDYDIKSYAYIRHSKDGIYHLFVTESYIDYENETEYIEKCQAAEKSVENFEKQMASYRDISIDDVLAERIAELTTMEKLDQWAEDEFGDDIDFSTVVVGFIFILAVLVFVVRAVLPDKKERKKASGGKKKTVKDIAPVKRTHIDRKKEKRTVDGLERTTVHCTYEDSLKSLLDSGLLTKKEYREMLEKHYR